MKTIALTTVSVVVFWTFIASAFVAVAHLGAV